MSAPRRGRVLRGPHRDQPPFQHQRLAFPLRRARSAAGPPGGQPNQGSTEVPACSLIVRRRFTHHRSIAFSAARIASRLAPPIEPSSGLSGM